MECSESVHRQCWCIKFQILFMFPSVFVVPESPKISWVFYSAEKKGELKRWYAMITFLISHPSLDNGTILLWELHNVQSSTQHLFALLMNFIVYAIASSFPTCNLSTQELLFKLSCCNDKSRILSTVIHSHFIYSNCKMFIKLFNCASPFSKEVLHINNIRARYEPKVWSCE